MSATPYIYRLDLQSGSAAEVRRSDFTDEEIAAARAVINQAIAENQSTPVLVNTVRGDSSLTIADGSTARRVHAVIWYGQGGGPRPALILDLALRSLPQAVQGSIGSCSETMSAAPGCDEEAAVPLAGRARRGAPARRARPLVPTIIRYPSVLAWAWIEHTKSARLPS
jgi:hypothetical protein